MFTKFKKFIPKTFIWQILILSPFIFTLNSFINPVKAGWEFQWDNDDNFNRLKWYQREENRGSRNKIYFFLRPSDRKTGLLKINLIVPKTFKTRLEEKNISICKVRIGGFNKSTKCIEQIPADIEINQEEKYKSVDIFPLKAIPSNQESYSIVLNVFNPKRTGLFQFHSYGQASGSIPVSSYLGSWTIVID